MNKTTISNINPVTSKVYIVFKRSDYSEAILLSVHATKEGAKKECQRLYERRISTRNPYNPYYWDEQEVQP